MNLSIKNSFFVNTRRLFSFFDFYSFGNWLEIMMAFPNRVVQIFSYSKVTALFWRFFALSQLVEHKVPFRKVRTSLEIDSSFVSLSHLFEYINRDSDFFSIFCGMSNRFLFGKLGDFFFFESIFLCRRFFFGFFFFFFFFFVFLFFFRFFFFFSDRTGDNPRIVITNYGRSFEERQQYQIEQQNKFPILCSAKLLCTFILFRIESGMGPFKVFFLIKRWQSMEFRKKNNFLYYVRSSKLVISRRFPLAGIRIMFLGSLHKGSRRKRLHYHLVIKNESFFRSMPFQDSNKLVEFFQLQAIRFASTLGIKVWVFLNSITSEQDRGRVGLLNSITNNE